jgi:hypothetical protein
MTIRGGVLLMPALAAAMLALTACTAPPTTTYTDPRGVEVTVDWSDYPGSEGTDADEVLQAPPEADVESTGAELMAGIERRLAEEFGLTWTESGGPSWYEQGGNGYGGPSSYITYNSPDLSSNGVPTSPAGWERVVAIVSEETVRAGLGAVVLDHERDTARSDREWREERFGTGNPDEYWSWTGGAFGDSQWLAVSLTDTDRDRTGTADEEFDGSIWKPQSITLSYGATVVPDASRVQFLTALEPFRGLPQASGDHLELSRAVEREKPRTIRFGAFSVRFTDSGGSKGIRTPDPLHAMQVRYRAAPWTHIVSRRTGKATPKDYYISTGPKTAFEPLQRKTAKFRRNLVVTNFGAGARSRCRTSSVRRMPALRCAGRASVSNRLDCYFVIGTTRPPQVSLM